MMVKELDLKLTLGMAKRRKTKSPPDEESWEGVSSFNPVKPKTHPLSESGCFLSNRSQYRLGIAHRR